MQTAHGEALRIPHRTRVQFPASPQDKARSPMVAGFFVVIRRVSADVDSVEDRELRFYRDPLTALFAPPGFLGPKSTRSEEVSRDSVQVPARYQVRAGSRAALTVTELQVRGALSNMECRRVRRRESRAAGMSLSTFSTDPMTTGLTSSAHLSGAMF